MKCAVHCTTVGNYEMGCITIVQDHNRHPQMPKKPLSMYMLYYSERREDIQVDRQIERQIDRLRVVFHKKTKK